MGMQVNELYDLEPSQFKNKLDGYNIQKQENQLLDAFFAFKVAYHVRDVKKGFGFDDFTEILPFYDEIKKDAHRSQSEWWEEKKKELAEEYGKDDRGAIS